MLLKWKGWEKLNPHVAPQGVFIEADIQVNAVCACGGRMEKVGPLEWKCEHRRWWDFLFGRGHAHLVAEAQIVRENEKN